MSHLVDAGGDRQDEDIILAVLPLEMVDNSMSSQELISGSFFFYSTVKTGYFILSVP